MILIAPQGCVNLRLMRKYFRTGRYFTAPDGRLLCNKAFLPGTQVTLIANPDSKVVQFGLKKKGRAIAAHTVRPRMSLTMIVGE